MSRTYHCEKKCCSIKVRQYKGNLTRRRRGHCRKAGVFIYDPKEERVLLVQSRGHLWGPPKGTLEIDRKETSQDCAIREVKEETGLDITVKNFKKATKIKNRALYYYSELPTCDIDVQDNDTEEQNDANGITWIKISCLLDCVASGKIILNQHCKITFRRFLKINIPSTDFVKVEHKKRRRRKISSF